MPDCYQLFFLGFADYLKNYKCVLCNRLGQDVAPSFIFVDYLDKTSGKMFCIRTQARRPSSDLQSRIELSTMLL